MQDKMANAHTDILELLKAAKQEAKDIIANLDPEHISSFFDLKEKLKQALEKVERTEKIYKLDPEKLFQQGG